MFTRTHTTSLPLEVQPLVLSSAFAAGVGGLHKSMGDGGPGFSDTYVHRIAVGMERFVGHHQERDGNCS